jgi:beta-phosphoglucomutase family hydrolase
MAAQLGSVQGNAWDGWDGFDAVLFDLDGVVTPTAEVHLRAWTEMFNAHLAPLGQPEFTDADYHAYVDGKPRFDGVRSFLASRGLPADEEEVLRLGLLKNDVFTEVLARDGVEPYPGSVAFIDHLETLGMPMAIVSSSANARPVLTAAGQLDRFDFIMDGVLATELGLPGKPQPDTFLHAAAALRAEPGNSVVLEDAVSGVTAAHAGGFQVVGVDRGAGGALTSAGADVLVSDLAQLLPGGQS